MEVCHIFYGIILTTVTAQVRDNGRIQERVNMDRQNESFAPVVVFLVGLGLIFGGVMAFQPGKVATPRTSTIIPTEISNEITENSTSVAALPTAGETTVEATAGAVEP